MKTCLVVDLGAMGYAEACRLQKRLVAARKLRAIDDVLLLCEHPHVITLGRNGKREHLLATEQVLRQKGVEFHATDRGGDITYHGPGQLVGYPILDLGGIRKDVGWYVRKLEEAMIRTSSEFNVSAWRVAGKTGIWVNNAQGLEEKLGAIGVHLSRWVTSHGFAYNISTDLRYFDLIVPCGIAERKATSLEKILDRAIRREAVIAPMVRSFGEIFELQMLVTPQWELLEQLRHAEPCNSEMNRGNTQTETASV
jgi:lipoyl(octanoyl) transferase